jgi:hypothetical protein
MDYLPINQVTLDGILGFDFPEDGFATRLPAAVLVAG